MNVPSSESYFCSSANDDKYRQVVYYANLRMGYLKLIWRSNVVGGTNDDENTGRWFHNNQYHLYNPFYDMKLDPLSSVPSQFAQIDEKIESIKARRDKQNGVSNEEYGGDMVGNKRSRGKLEVELRTTKVKKNSANWCEQWDKTWDDDSRGRCELTLQFNSMDTPDFTQLEYLIPFVNHLHLYIPKEASPYWQPVWKVMPEHSEHVQKKYDRLSMFKMIGNLASIKTQQHKEFTLRLCTHNYAEWIEFFAKHEASLTSLATVEFNMTSYILTQLSAEKMIEVANVTPARIRSGKVDVETPRIYARINVSAHAKKHLLQITQHIPNIDGGRYNYKTKGVEIEVVSHDEIRRHFYYFARRNFLMFLAGSGFLKSGGPNEITEDTSLNAVFSCEQLCHCISAFI